VTNEIVVLQAADGVAMVTLNRPAARNALSRELLACLYRIVSECERRADIAVMVVTGADPAFCAGLDLKELGASNALLRQAERAPFGPTPGAAASRPATDGGRSGSGAGTDGPATDGGLVSNRVAPPSGPFPPRRKPLIGAINGAAITGGLELALACDFLIASERACFADTHARVGVQPAWGLTVLLPQAIGHRRAREMSTTGNFVDAETALAWGLVNHVVVHDRLLEVARSMAVDIAGNDPAGVERILATYAEGSMLSPDEAWNVELNAASQWLKNGNGRPDEVARRRQAIIERGRVQAAPRSDDDFRHR
jgi:enoyl-CoA hydratase